MAGSADPEQTVASYLDLNCWHTPFCQNRFGIQMFRTITGWLFRCTYETRYFLLMHKVECNIAYTDQVVERQIQLGLLVAKIIMPLILL